MALLYNIACCHSSVGDVRSGLVALSSCLELGYLDFDILRWGTPAQLPGCHLAATWLPVAHGLHRAGGVARAWWLLWGGGPAGAGKPPGCGATLPQSSSSRWRHSRMTWLAHHSLGGQGGLRCKPGRQLGQHRTCRAWLRGGGALALALLTAASGALPLAQGRP
jgi:hypothetical protein